MYLFFDWFSGDIYCIYIFFTQRTTDFDELKRNMNDGTIVFLTSLLIALKNVPLLTKTFSPKVFRVVNFFTKM